MLQISLDAFRFLCDILQSNYGLQPTQNVSVEKSVAMFQRICGQNEVERDFRLWFGWT